MLLMPEFDRFSIDIDIIGTFSKDELKRLIHNTIFTRIDEDTRQVADIPKKHFKFYYGTLSGKEDHVLLDMLTEKVPYEKMTIVPIKTDLFEVDEILNVTIPTVDEILGDKLTAFAPNTIGIPYILERTNNGTGKTIKTAKNTEILKQLFDIGRLYDHISNFELVKNTYSRIASQEAKYRHNEFTIEDTLRNTFQTALKICRIDLRGFTEDEESKALREGIGSVGNFLFNGRLTYDDAKIIAAKAALLAIIIHNNLEITDISDYHASEESIKLIADKQLPREFGSLQKLKTINPECFFYLYKISKVIYAWVLL